MGPRPHSWGVYIDTYAAWPIGWTSKSHDEVEAVCQMHMREYSPYGLLTNNCQMFAHRVCDTIIDNKAIGWLAFAPLPMRLAPVMRKDKQRRENRLAWLAMHPSQDILDYKDHSTVIT